jgi:putative ABC transport system substrate-binding protein
MDLWRASGDLGNVTGVSFLAPQLGSKRLQLLRELAPGVLRVGVLRHPGVYSEPTMREMSQEAHAGAKAIGVELQVFDAKTPADFDPAFAAMAKARVGAVILFPSPMFYIEYQRLVDVAAKYRLPTMYYFPEAVKGGGLICYGVDISHLFRRAAIYVDKILNGAKPADLPVEQPTKFELVLNLKTGKALSLTIPPSLVQRADQVIE